MMEKHEANIFVIIMIIFTTIQILHNAKTWLKPIGHTALTDDKITDFAYYVFGYSGRYYNLTSRFDVVKIIQLLYASQIVRWLSRKTDLNREFLTCRLFKGG